MESYTNAPILMWCKMHGLRLNQTREWDVDPSDSLLYYFFSTMDKRDWTLVIDVEDFTYEAFQRHEEAENVKDAETLFESGKLILQAKSSQKTQEEPT